MKIQKAAALTAAGTPDAAQLEKINAFARTPLTAEEVYVFSVRLCDDQPDRDGERFAAAALPELARLFRGKTGIADHDWSADRQVARIFDTAVEVQDGVTMIRAWAYCLRTEKNADLIREIDAGIKKEVSVGCAMKSAVCSICGAPYGSCEHRKGQQYGQEVCCAVLSDPVDAYEFSFVAVPAQREAGVLKGFGGQAAPDGRDAEDTAPRRCDRLRREAVTLALTLGLGKDAGTLDHIFSFLPEQELENVCQVFLEQRDVRFPPAPQLGWAEKRKEDDDFYRI